MIENELLQVPDRSGLLFQLFLLACCCFAVMVFFMPAVRAFFFPSNKRTRLSDHIGYERIENDGRTVICRDGSRFQVIRIRGLDTDALSSNAQHDLFMKRKQWLTNLTNSGSFAFQGRLLFVDTRRVVDLTRHNGHPVSEYIEKIFRQYMRRFSRSYRNTHYVVVIVPGNSVHPQEQLDTTTRNLVRQLGSLESANNSYGAEPLTLGKKTQAYSPLLTYLAQMVNPGFTTYVHQDALGNNRVAEVICQSRVAFESREFDLRRGDGIALFSHKGRKCWMGAVMLHTSAVRWGDDLPKRLLSLDQKLTLAQWLTPLDQRQSQAYVKEYIKNGYEEGSTNTTAMEVMHGAELVDIRSAETGELFFDYEMTVFVLGDTRSEVVDGIHKVTEAIEDSKFTAIQVTDELDERWFCLHPPYRTDTRPMKPFTSNVANFICFPSPQQGYEKSDWGQRPIQFFHTAAKSAYGMIFHALDSGKAPGHTALFGETGGGKTVLQNFLAASTLAHPDARVFIFDRFDSSYVFTKACGGKYIHIDTSHDIPNAEIARLNPFSLDLRPDGTGDTPFVHKWLSDHALCLSDTETTAEISRILRLMSKLPLSARNMVEFEKECREGTQLKEEAKRWCPGGEYGHILSTRQDSLNFGSDCRLFTFDATSFLEVPRLSQAIIPLISYRIEQQVSALGCPWLMIMDETKACLQGSPNFVKWYLKLHDEARRLRGVIVSSFQRVSQAVALGVLGTIREACHNHIFLPNENADRADYMDGLGLGDREFAAVKMQSDYVQDLDHFIVLRRKTEGSVILSTDLSELNQSEDGPLLDLFESGPEAAGMFRQCEREYGEGIAAVPAYLALQAEKKRRLGSFGHRLEEAAE